MLGPPRIISTSPQCTFHFSFQTILTLSSKLNYSYLFINLFIHQSDEIINVFKFNFLTHFLDPLFDYLKHLFHWYPAFQLSSHIFEARTLSEPYLFLLAHPLTNLLLSLTNIDLPSLGLLWSEVSTRPPLAVYLSAKTHHTPSPMTKQRCPGPRSWCRWRSESSLLSGASSESIGACTYARSSLLLPEWNSSRLRWGWKTWRTGTERGSDDALSAGRSLCGLCRTSGWSSSGFSGRQYRAWSCVVLSKGVSRDWEYIVLLESIIVCNEGLRRAFRGSRKGSL